VHYFIYASKDSYITENSPGNIILYPDSSDRNYGGDEIVELKKEFTNSYSTSSYNVSRILTQFDYSDLKTYVLDGTITNPKFYLRYYEVEGQKELNKSYTLSTFPLSQSWEEGTGKHFDNPKITDGVTWESGSSGWIYTSDINADSGSRLTPGGGIWQTSNNIVPNYYMCTQSFQNQSGDIEMDISQIVNAHIAGGRNDGIITKFFSGSLGGTVDVNYEDDGTPLHLKFFSRNTHTIYAPKLEIRWDDHNPVTGSNTGSLLPLTMSGEINNHIFIKGLQPTYRESEKVRFRMGCRKKYVQRTFTNSIHSSSFYVPEGSGSYSIVDVATNTDIVPFSDYTKLSCDLTSMYFDQWLNTFEPGRYYKILFKLNYSDGQEIIIDNDEEFKVI